MNTEITEKMAKLIKEIFDFSVDTGMNPMASMHLHQAFLHLEMELEKFKKPYPIPVMVALNADEFDAFIAEIMMSKPYPQNLNQPAKGN